MLTGQAEFNAGRQHSFDYLVGSNRFNEPFLSNNPNHEVTEIT